MNKKNMAFAFIAGCFHSIDIKCYGNGIVFEWNKDWPLSNFCDPMSAIAKTLHCLYIQDFTRFPFQLRDMDEVATGYNSFGHSFFENDDFEVEIIEAINWYSDRVRDMENNTPMDGRERMKMASKEYWIDEYNKSINEANRWLALFGSIKEIAGHDFMTVMGRAKEISRKRNLANSCLGEKKKANDCLRQLRALGFVA